MEFPFGIQEVNMTHWTLLPNYIWFAISFVIVFATFGTYLLNPLALSNLKATTVKHLYISSANFAGLFAIDMGSDQLDILKISAAILIFIGVYLVSKK